MMRSMQATEKKKIVPQKKKVNNLDLSISCLVVIWIIFNNIYNYLFSYRLDEEGDRSVTNLLYKVYYFGITKFNCK
jgi:hypothetical protein